MIHVTTTVDTPEAARRLAQLALEARLAACANITPGLVSLFHWQGVLAEEAEVSVTFKTMAHHRDALIAMIEDAHPYDLPVITWEEVGANAAAEAWCQAETAPSDD